MKKFDFTIRGTKYEVEVKNIENNVAEIEVNGSVYQVEIHKEIQKQKTPILVRKEVSSPVGADKIEKTQSGAYKVTAPLPGNIFQIGVEVGAQVKKGDKLLIMEAMKMENNVLSEKDGVVKAIRVKVGDSVLQGDVLMEIE